MAEAPRVFLGASAFIAAGASPSGGSALVAGVCKSGLATPLVFRLVLWEAERNLRDKFQANALLEKCRAVSFSGALRSCMNPPGSRPHFERMWVT